jgi:hypothetical protein
MQGQEQRYDCAAMQRDSRFPELFGMGWNQPQSGFKPMKYCTLWGHLYVHMITYVCILWHPPKDRNNYFIGYVFHIF